VRDRAEDEAAVFLGEDGARASLTWAKLSRAVTKLAETLVDLGVEPGGRVNRGHALRAMLARPGAVADAIALGRGTGSELRRPLGIAIVGGLLISQVLTLYTTPVVYLYLDRWRLGLLGHRAADRLPQPGE